MFRAGAGLTKIVAGLISPFSDRHEFVVGSRPCSEGFLPGSPETFEILAFLLEKSLVFLYN